MFFSYLPSSIGFYSHVICSGTKILPTVHKTVVAFYSHVICSGTKIKQIGRKREVLFYSHVICSGTKMSNLLIPDVSETPI